MLKRVDRLEKRAAAVAAANDEADWHWFCRRALRDPEYQRLFHLTDTFHPGRSHDEIRPEEPLRNPEWKAALDAFWDRAVDLVRQFGDECPASVRATFLKDNSEGVGGWPKAP